MPLGWPCTKEVQIILIGWKIWQPEGVAFFSYVDVGKMVVREITLAVGVNFDFPVIFLDKWER